MDSSFGLGMLPGQIDDAAFEIAAKKAHAEGLGISLIWRKDMKIEDFVSFLLSHADAVIYPDVTTGKLSIKLLRDDYVRSELPVFSGDEIGRAHV